MANSSFLTVMAAGVGRRKTYSAVPTGNGWFGVIRESFSGAFQQVVEVDAPRTILAFSAVFSCVTLIASDIAKLSLRLMIREFNGATWIDRTFILDEAKPLLKPNHYQTRSQFITQWMICKLLYGNSYALKQRDARGIVTALYILDPQRVTPLVTESGDVYYRLSSDHLSRLIGEVTVPASEIIHDRMNCLWHPLVGISPIFACGMSATVGNKIQGNSARFFQNMSRPSGMLSAPAEISDETAARLKSEFESNFSGSGLGRLFVAGSDLKYTGLAIAAVDAQLIEQLKWSVEDVARSFKVPLHLINAGPAPNLNTVQALEQNYYSRTLQGLIEDMEQCLDAGLELKPWQRTEFDLDGLLRMDTAARYAAHGTAVKDGWMKVDEARAMENMPPVAGGDDCYLQQQYWALSQLARRTAAPDGVQPGDATAKAIEALLLRDALQTRSGRGGYITRDHSQDGGGHDV